MVALWKLYRALIRQRGSNGGSMCIVVCIVVCHFDRLYGTRVGVCWMLHGVERG